MKFTVAVSALMIASASAFAPSSISSTHVSFSILEIIHLGYLLKKIGIPEPSWGIVGRWTYYMIKNGAFFNPTIIEKPEFKYEVLLGWVFHYFISISWAVIYYIIFINVGIKMSYFSGVIFGAITTLAPLIIFLPFTGIWTMVI